MKTWRILTAWNWRIIQKPVWLIIALGSAAQMAAVCIYSCLRTSAAITYNSVLINSLSWIIFALEFLAVLGASQRPVLMMNGKTKLGYTMQTLPSSASTLFFSNAASTALAIMCVLSAQLLLTFIMYFPATALTTMTAQTYIPQYPMPTPDMQLSLVRTVFFNLLLPTNLFGIITLPLYIIAPSLLLPGAFFHKGMGRIFGIIIGVFGAAVCGYMLARRILARGYWNDYDTLPIIALLLIIMIFSVLWTLRTIKRAKWL